MRLTIWVCAREILDIQLVNHDSKQVLAETIAGFLDEANPAPLGDDEAESLVWPPRVEEGGTAIYTGEMFEFECPDDTSELPLPPNDA